MRLAVGVVLPGQTVVAVSDNVIVGSAKMGPNRPGRRSHMATASFLVDPACQWGRRIAVVLACSYACRPGWGGQKSPGPVGGDGSR